MTVITDRKKALELADRLIANRKSFDKFSFEFGRWGWEIKAEVKDSRKITKYTPRR